MPKCKADGCEKSANFNFSGEESGIYCKSHSTKDMLYMKSARCLHDGCHKRRIMGFPGKKREYCKAHAVLGMINLNASICIHQDCDTRASYGFPGKKESIALDIC